MVNDLSGFIPELWSARIQKMRQKMLVSAAVSSFEEQKGLTYGDTVHRPTMSDFVVNDYVRGVPVTPQDITNTDDTLLINKSKEVSFYIDKLDEVQSKYDIEMAAVKRATYKIKDEMDMTRFKETINATYVADAGDNGGTAGTAATLTPSTAVQFFETAKARLRSNNVEDDRGWYAVVSPTVTGIIAQTFIGAGFNLADSALKNGYKGDAFGLKIYESNNLLHTRVATPTSLVNTNTLVVAGVTFTFATTATAAGDIDLWSNDADAIANAVLAINGTGTPSATTYIDISAADRILIKNAGVYATGTTTVLTLYGRGSFTATENSTTIVLWSLICHNEMWQMWAVDMVVQMYPDVQKNKEPKMSGYTWIILDLYGVKTFQEGKDRMIDLQTIA